MTVAGFGFRREALLASLIDALERIEKHHGAVDRLAATHTMCPLVQALGKARGIAVIAVADAALSTATTITRSRHSLQARGTGSVAEAVALLAAGPGAELLGPRLISADRLATAAVARAPLRGD
ncbi:cobalamin biosynthesis protein [Litchfieldella rifensis]|uniref:Cobalamin biosynthesis protein n=1 Tax=Litchfieldella rifensis TaxID=762643 RepID=A0ABV7LLJ2_9GAMM